MASTRRTSAQRPRPLAVPDELAAGDVFTSRLTVGEQCFERQVIATAWAEPGIDLVAFLRRSLDASPPVSGDVVAVSEKLVLVATGRGIPASRVTPGRLALALAARVHPTAGSLGLSIPEKMQLVLESVGATRLAAAAALSALTRPLGIHGTFYRVAGPVARDIDGMRPPYEDLLLPPLDAEEASILAEHLATAIGHPVAIVDMNDRGGSIRAISGHLITERMLAEVLADNPHGQRDRSTPLAIVRRVEAEEPAHRQHPSTTTSD